jgi:hypothetical protein
VKGLAKFSGRCGLPSPGGGQRDQAGDGPGAPATPKVPGPRQAGARGSPRRPARPRPAAPRSRCPLTEPGAPGGRGNKEPRVLPRTVGASSHSREVSAPSRLCPAMGSCARLLLLLWGCSAVAAGGW